MRCVLLSLFSRTASIFSIFILQRYKHFLMFKKNCHSKLFLSDSGQSVFLMFKILGDRTVAALHNREKDAISRVFSVFKHIFYFYENYFFLHLFISLSFSQFQFSCLFFQKLQYKFLAVNYLL